MLENMGHLLFGVVVVVVAGFELIGLRTLDLIVLHHVILVWATVALKKYDRIS